MDNIFIMFGWRVFQQTVCIPTCTNCAPLLADLIGDYVDSIYQVELEIKDTTYTAKSASYLDYNLQIESEGRFRTKFYDKPAYGVYISQLIRYYPSGAPKFVLFTCVSGVRIVHVVKSYVFMFLVPCCDVCSDFRVKTMVDSSRLPL
jgi:hypothetical protein